MNKYFKDKIILVTGGVGSIGGHLVNKLLTFQPKAVRIYDNSELGLFNAVNKYKSKKIRPLLGDVRDSERLKKAMENVDIVFHAAALKHVELSEFNPFEVVKTNILGTENVLKAAIEQNVGKVLVISTDKAVNPINTMGASKLLAEKLTIAASYHRGNSKTRFGVVRFGNVLGTNGSVVPIWKEQILQHKELNITDKKVTRFMISPFQAIDLVLNASIMMDGGETFILKMPNIKLIDLAEVVISYLSKENKFKENSINIKEVGLKPGEKIHEELVSSEELGNLYELENMYVLYPASNLMGLSMIKNKKKNTLKKVLSTFNYSSNLKNFLKKNEILDLLKESKLL